MAKNHVDMASKKPENQRISTANASEMAGSAVGNSPLAYNNEKLKSLIKPWRQASFFISSKNTESEDLKFLTGCMKKIEDGRELSEEEKKLLPEYLEKVQALFTKTSWSFFNSTQQHLLGSLGSEEYSKTYKESITKITSALLPLPKFDAPPQKKASTNFLVQAIRGTVDDDNKLVAELSGMIKEKSSGGNTTSQLQSLVKEAEMEVGRGELSSFLQRWHKYYFEGHFEGYGDMRGSKNSSWKYFRLMLIFSAPELYTLFQATELEETYRVYGDKPSFTSIPKTEWKTVAEIAAKNYEEVMRKMNAAQQPEVAALTTKPNAITATTSSAAGGHTPTPFANPITYQKDAAQKAASTASTSAVAGAPNQKESIGSECKK